VIEPYCSIVKSRCETRPGMPGPAPYGAGQACSFCRRGGRKGVWLPGLFMKMITLINDDYAD